MKLRHVPPGEKINLMMTPMIDVVFQLLIFFMLNLRIVAPEGDFNIKMPLGAAAERVVPDIPLPAIQVRLVADAEGRLSAIRMGDRPLGNFAELHENILAMVGDVGPGGVMGDTEVEIDADYDLRYEYVVEAMTAISGRVRGNEIIPLVEKIKFAPPRRANNSASS